MREQPTTVKTVVITVLQARALLAVAGFVSSWVLRENNRRDTGH